MRIVLTKLRQFWHARGRVLDSNSLNFETLLHNFTSISTICQNFIAIRPAATVNLCGQNLGEEEENNKLRRIIIRSNGAKNNKSHHFVWET